MTADEKLGAMNAAQLVMQEMRKGKTRIHPDFIPIIRAIILCKMQEHVNTLAGYERTEGRYRTPAVEAGIVYRKNVIRALQLMVDTLADKMPRRLFWDIASDVFLAEGVIDAETEFGEPDEVEEKPRKKRG